MQIIEIYRSIQGESTFAGRPCTFVRLAACNLRCVWCDSEYTFSGGRRMSVEEVEAEVGRLNPTSAKGGQMWGTAPGLKPGSAAASVRRAEARRFHQDESGQESKEAKEARRFHQDESGQESKEAEARRFHQDESGQESKEAEARRFHRPLVEITGGEPMLQEREVVPLMERLLASGYEVLLETSGERPLARVPQAVHKIVDVKCPGSGEGGSFRMENLAALRPADEVKFVVASREDYEFAREFTRAHELEGQVGAVIFSPAFRRDARGARDASHCLLDPQELAEWIVGDGLEVRLGLQIHKFIWAPETKGV